MGSYQPIQISSHSPMLEAMGGVGQSLQRLGDQRERQAREAEAQKRQAQQDFQATLMQAKKLAADGDMQSAAALMAPYQAELAQMGGPPPPPAAGQGGSPLPDGMEFPGGPRPGGLEQNSNPADFDTDHGQAPSQTAPEPPQQPNPIMAARQAQVGQQQAQNQARARTVLNFRAPGGGQMSIDPEAQRQGQLEQRAARLDSAFATVEDPELKQMYQTIRPVLMSSTQDVDPSDVFKYLSGEVANKRAIAAAGEAALAKEGRDNAQEDRRDKRQDKSLAQSDKNSQRAAEAMAASLANRGNPAEDKLRAETVFDLAGNPVGRALSPEEGEKLHAAQAATRSLLTSLDRIKDFNAQHGTRLVPGVHATEIKDRDILATTATGYLTTMFQTGVLNGAEYERYSAMLKGAWTQSGEGANQNLGTLATGIGDAYNNRVRSQGIGGTAPGSTPADPRSAAVAAQKDRNAERAGKVKRGGKGTPPKKPEDYLRLLDGGH